MSSSFSSSLDLFFSLAIARHPPSFSSSITPEIVYLRTRADGWLRRRNAKSAGTGTSAGRPKASASLPKAFHTFDTPLKARHFERRPQSIFSKRRSLGVLRVREDKTSDSLHPVRKRVGFRSQPSGLVQVELYARSVRTGFKQDALLAGRGDQLQCTECEQHTRHRAVAHWALGLPGHCRGVHPTAGTARQPCPRPLPCNHRAQQAGPVSRERKRTLQSESPSFRI